MSTRRRRRKPEPLQVVLTLTCPESGVASTETIDTPLDRKGWGATAGMVAGSLCDCGRPHHPTYSDEAPHTFPQPVIARRLDGRIPPLGVAS